MIDPDPAVALADDDIMAREHVLDAAYHLFSRRGVRAVDLDEVVTHSGIGRATLNRHFRTKDDLVLAVLGAREQRWTLGMVETQARGRATTPEGQLPAVFDVFDGWFNTEEFDSCTFINVLLEMGWDHPLGKASIAYLSNIRFIIETFAREAGLRDPREFAHCWHILMKGSIIAAAEGDRLAAKRAQRMGRLLIEHHREHSDVA